MNERILDGRLAKNKNRNNYSEFVCTETESNVTKANTSAANVDFMAGFGNSSKTITSVCVRKNSYASYLPTAYSYRDGVLYKQPSSLHSHIGRGYSSEFLFSDTKGWKTKLSALVADCRRT